MALALFSLAGWLWVASFFNMASCGTSVLHGLVASPGAVHECDIVGLTCDGGYAADPHGTRAAIRSRRGKKKLSRSAPRWGIERQSG